jgi:hypothetical protein
MSGSRRHTSREGGLQCLRLPAGSTTLNPLRRWRPPAAGSDGGTAAGDHHGGRPRLSHRLGHTRLRGLRARCPHQHEHRDQRSTYRAAARRLRESGGDCGVHLNLFMASRFRPAPRFAVSSMQWTLSLATVGRFLLRYEGRVVRIREVALEWERQVQRAFDDGLVPSHLNAHYHLHALPGLFRLAVDLARRFEIGWVRVPDEPPWRAPGRAVGRARATALWLLARWNRRVTRSLGSASCPAGASPQAESSDFPRGAPCWTACVGSLSTAMRSR